MTATPPLLDLYSPLDGKIGDTASTITGLAPTWVPKHDQRRLAAYRIRDAYRSNQAQLFVDEKNSHLRREYGDPALYEDRMVSVIRGDQQTIVVDGADDNLIEGPRLPARPDPAPADADELVKRIADGRLAAWTAEAEAIVTRWEAALLSQPAAQARQDGLRGWADQIRLGMHLTEAEHDTVGLGDGLLVLWPRPNAWPTVQVFDPACYFPVFPDNGDQADFADVIHLIWEYDDETTGVKRKMLRRLTWEIIEITETRAVADPAGDGYRWVGPDGVELGPDEPLILSPTDALGADGIITRTLPWHTEDDAPTRRTCVFSDLTWDTKDIGDTSKVGIGSRALDRSKATITQDRYDLGIDFIPVVHRPNTLTGKEHFGRSLFDLVVKLFDDLARVDTLTISAANFLGKPAIALTGATAADGQVAPGRIFNVGKDGRMDVLDLSAGITQLLALGGLLADRLGMATGLSGEITGRETGNNPTSGFDRLLKLLPAISVVGSLRQIREPKDRLILKFAQRMAQVAGALEPGPTPTARIGYGNFLPTDQAGAVELVSKGLTAHGMSLQTAVAVLVAAGYPIDDAQAEVDRIRAENPQAAAALADATGSEALAAAYLGVELPEAAAPVVDLP